MNVHFVRELIGKIQTKLDDEYWVLANSEEAQTASDIQKTLLIRKNVNKSIFSPEQIVFIDKIIKQNETSDLWKISLVFQNAVKDWKADWETIYSPNYQEGVSGTKRTKYKGKEHSRNDEPSFIGYYPNGAKTLGWHKKDKCHRLTGPARIWPNGDKEYWIEDEYYDYESWLKKRKEHPDWKDSMLESE